MAQKNHSNSVKDDEQYEALRDEGMSKEKAARIANTDRQVAGKRGGEEPRYEDWSADEIYERAQELGVEGRSEMTKQELIAAMRQR